MVMRVDDSLAFLRPKAYPIHSETLAAARCSRRSLDAVSPQAARGQGWQMTPSSLPVLVPTIRKFAILCVELLAHSPPACRPQRGDRSQPFLPVVCCGLPS